MTETGTPEWKGRMEDQIQDWKKLQPFDYEKQSLNSDKMICLASQSILFVVFFQEDRKCQTDLNIGY